MPAPSKRPQQLLLGTCLLAVLAATAAAGRTEPLHDPDNGALSGTFYFPDSTEGASLVPRGRHAFSMFAITSSHSTNETRGDEMLTLDGETTRVELRYRYGLGERFEIGLRRDDNQLEFSYQDATGTQLDYQRNSNGIGDLRLIAGWRLTDGPKHRSALRFGLKLPTGDSDDLHGSGGTDFSVGIAGDWPQLFGYDRLNAFYRAHVNFLGKPDLLAGLYNDVIGQLSTGAGFQLTRSIELRLQAAARSATHDSDIEILGQDAAWITFGGHIRLSDDYELSLAVTEDLNVRSAPDISFLIALRYDPKL